MTDSSPSLVGSQPAPDRGAEPARPAAGAPPVWVDALLVLWLGVLLLTPFPQPGRFLAGDPLHYAAIAKSTLASGNWLELQLGSQPYFNKPPLMFWLTMGAFKLFGASTFVAQSTGACFGIAMLLATWALGCRLGNRRSGLLAALSLATTYVFVKNASVLRLDAPTAVCILGGIWSVWAGRRRPGLLPLFWISAALAVAFKGPAGLLGVPVLAVWSLLRRDLHPWKSPLFWSTLPLLPLPVLPWILHNVERHPRLFAEAWYQNNVVLNLVTDRGKPPFAKYGSDLLFEGWPWLPFLLHGAWLTARALWRGSRDDRWTLPAAWVVGIMVPLLCMSNAFSRYVFPLLPASAFLVATSLLTLWPGLLGRRFYIGIAAFLLGLSVLTAVAGERLVKDRTPDIVRFYPWLESHGRAVRLYELDNEVAWYLQSASIFYLDREMQSLPPSELSAQLRAESSVAALVLHTDPTHPGPAIEDGIHSETIQQGEDFDLVLFTREGTSKPGG